MTLIPVDTSSELAVSSYLEQARDWLARAVDETGPEQIAAAKAEIATAAEATKQLGLSKEIQLDAQEMVRRAEYALGKAIRKGQAEGTVAKRSDNQWTLSDDPHNDSQKSRPTDFASRRELFGANANQAGIYDLSDGVSDQTFDRAIDDAKAEGNLSRANLARKIIGASEVKAKRKPLPDVARDTGWELRRAVEKVARLVEDDRFDTHKPQVAPHLRSHLENAIEVCQDLLDRINNN